MNAHDAREHAPIRFIVTSCIESPPQLSTLPLVCLTLPLVIIATAVATGHWQETRSDDRDNEYSFLKSPLADCLL